MRIDSDGSKLVLGRGKLYFDRFDANGVATGELFAGNCEEFTIENAIEDLKKYDSTIASNPLLKRVILRLTPTVAFSMDEFQKENLALALSGGESTYSQAAATVVAESKSVVNVDRWYKLAWRSISAVVVKKGATTLTIDTDYKVDATTGRIYVVGGGALAAGDTMLVDYTAAALLTTAVLPKVTIGTSPVIEGSLRFVADNATGPKWHAEFWKLSFQGDGAVGFISDDWGQFKIKAEVLSDSSNHPTEPLGRLIQQ